MLTKNKKHAPRHVKGQSTVEYLLLVTGVIAVLIFFTTNKNAGLQGKLTNTYDAATEHVDYNDKFVDSHFSKDAPKGTDTRPKINVTIPDAMPIVE